MHIRKIIGLHKRGTEAIGAELSGPPFIRHDHYFGTRTFSSEQISNVCSSGLAKLAGNSRRFFVCSWKGRGAPRGFGWFPKSVGMRYQHSSFLSSCCKCSEAFSLQCCLLLLWQQGLKISCLSWHFPCCQNFPENRSSLRDSCSYIFSFFLVTLIRSVYVCVSKNIWVCVMSLIATSVKSEAEKQQLSWLVEIHYSKVSQSPVVCVPHL